MISVSVIVSSAVIVGDRVSEKVTERVSVKSDVAEPVPVRVSSTELDFVGVPIVIVRALVICEGVMLRVRECRDVDIENDRREDALKLRECVN
jgi:hypothetical protein